MSTKVKIALCATFILLNAFVYLYARRDTASKQPPVKVISLAECSLEEREEFVTAAFAQADFHITPLAADSESVAIPRPMKWLEQMILSTDVVNTEPAERESDETKKDSASKESKLPWRAGAIRIKIKSILVAAYETATIDDTAPAEDAILADKIVPADKANSILLVKERLISRDAYMTKNGIEVPVLEMLGLSRYYLDHTDNTLLTSQKAVQVNGRPQMVFQADVPQWLVPARKIAIGETWVQLGAHPRGVPSTAPRPEAVRTLNRLVMFEGRRAAEISAMSTFYDFTPGPQRTHTKRMETSLTYLDLETGEPLWYEARGKDDREAESVVRGCNQIFTKHLIRTKPRS